MELGEEFQLTPSRRATLTGGKLTGVKDISTHALTEGDNGDGARSAVENISTHALTEGDAKHRARRTSWKHFNSRPHGGRRIQVLAAWHGSHFNSRPHGGRQNSPVYPLYWGLFQLTPSRRATAVGSVKGNLIENFNSRPHGGRPLQLESSALPEYFNSRPHGGRQ